MTTKLGEKSHFHEAVSEMTNPDFLNAVSRHLDWMTLIAAVRCNFVQILDGGAVMQKVNTFCDENYQRFSHIIEKCEDIDPGIGYRLLSAMTRESTQSEIMYILIRLQTAQVYSDVEPLYQIQPDTVWSCFPEVVFHDDRKVTQRKAMTPRIPDYLCGDLHECIDDNFLLAISLFIEAEVMWDEYKLDMMKIHGICPNIVSICTSMEEYYEDEFCRRLNIHSEAMEHVEDILHDVLFRQKYADSKRIQLLKQKFASIESFDEFLHSKPIYPVTRGDFTLFIEPSKSQGDLNS